LLNLELVSSLVLIRGTLVLNYLLPNLMRDRQQELTAQAEVSTEGFRKVL